MRFLRVAKADLAAVASASPRSPGWASTICNKSSSSTAGAGSRRPAATLAFAAAIRFCLLSQRPIFVLVPSRFKSSSSSAASSSLPPSPDFAACFLALIRSFSRCRADWFFLFFEGFWSASSPSASKRAPKSGTSTRPKELANSSFGSTFTSKTSLSFISITDRRYEQYDLCARCRTSGAPACTDANCCPMETSFCCLAAMLRISIFAAASLSAKAFSEGSRKSAELPELWYLAVRPTLWM
mmetsp:Transcript_32710/g.52678  ORF Transcript_32710/g.52678 Transcript_32710/m.52678 type:complete len:241 (+) Transcript_32710:629-1351(+)